MPASERYGRKGQEVTKGKYEKDHFGSSSSCGIRRDGRIDGERGRAVLLWDSRAGGHDSRSRSRSGAAGRVRASRCLCPACGLRSASRLCAAGSVRHAESLLPARARGSFWF